MLYLFVAALWNRAGHYILSCGFFLSVFLFSSSFFPRLISAASDWMSTIYTSTHGVALVMVALCNRADHYIFAVCSYLLSSSFPRLISAIGDWMSTILSSMI